MTTSRQPGADRALPNRSTGPRSAAGKARSSMNALKSGIYSKSLTIPGEDPAQLAALLDEYLQRFHPTVPEQRDLVDILVRSTWTLRRLATAEAQVWIYEMETAYKLTDTAPLGEAFCAGDRTLSRLQRMVTATQRNYRDALHELERLQERRLNTPSKSPQPIENKPVTTLTQFVPSSAAPHPPAPQKAAPKPPKNRCPSTGPAATAAFPPSEFPNDPE